MAKKKLPKRGSAGGNARRDKLSKEKRAEIASRAAAARWNIPRATHAGEIQIGNAAIPCAVLEDGTRILSQFGFLQALGRSGRPSGEFDENLRIVGASNLKPFVSKELANSIKPISYAPEKGGRGLGFKAELLPQVCDVYLKAREAGELHQTQKRAAQAAELVVRGLASVGITALVDEATGYQEVRAKRALAEILEKFLETEFRPWTKTFPFEFYEHMFRLRGWKFDPATMQGPRAVAQYTEDLIYRRLAPGVCDELKRKNPRVDGKRKQKHHQWLTGDVGHPRLLAHIEAIKSLMMVNDDWDEFMEMVDKVYPIVEVTEMGLEIEIKTKTSKKKI